MGKSYKKLLKDPRWQKKRLKVLERAGWACVRCGDDKTELHVHHTFYDGRKPWKYPKWSLECLCKDCHEEEHDEDEEADDEEEHDYGGDSHDDYDQFWCEKCGKDTAMCSCCDDYSEQESAEDFEKRHDP